VVKRKTNTNIRKLKAHKAEAQKPKPLWLACALVVACSLLGFVVPKFLFKI
jgi:pilus assembly protein TadC